jgi:hypothetical protein
MFRLVNLQAKNYYLYTHKKKMDDFNGDFEVCSVKYEGGSIDPQNQQQATEPQAIKQEGKPEDYREWVVCENEPYIVL